VSTSRSLRELTENPTLQELPTQLLDSPTVSDLESCCSFLRHRRQARQPSDWATGPSIVKLVLRSAYQVTVFQPSPLGLRQVVPFVWLQNRTDPCIDAVHFIVSSLCGPLEARRFLRRRRRFIAGHPRVIHMLSNGPNVNEKKDRREQEQSKRTPHHPVILGHYQISPNAFFMHQPKSVRKGRVVGPDCLENGIFSNFVCLQGDRRGSY
jgi:hypothetical protein